MEFSESDFPGDRYSRLIAGTKGMGETSSRGAHTIQHKRSKQEFCLRKFNLFILRKVCVHVFAEGILII